MRAATSSMIFGPSQGACLASTATVFQTSTILEEDCMSVGSSIDNERTDNNLAY